MAESVSYHSIPKEVQEVQEDGEETVPHNTPMDMKKAQLQKIVEFPKSVLIKIDALKKLQLDAFHVEAEFHLKVHELEMEFQKKFQEIHLKRSDIVNGLYFPKKEDLLNLDDANEIEEGDGEKIQNFWLTIFKLTPLLQPMVQPCDENVLTSLEDVRVTVTNEPEPTFTLEFYFKPNEYFTNDILTKKYMMKCSPNQNKLMLFDGFEIYDTRGCEIDWKEGKCLTKIHLDASNSLKVNSFFHFFDPPKSMDEPAVAEYLETDFEIGYYIKERVIPRAVLFFTGEIEDEFEDGSEDYCDFNESDAYRLLGLTITDEEEGDGDF